jgi:SAM-dependent methyltransferase
MVASDPPLDEPPTPGAYGGVHSYLVANTEAYQDLLRALPDRAVGVPDGPRIAVPSSTGEFVKPLLGLGPPWHLLDVDRSVLDRARALLGPSVTTDTIDLEDCTEIGPGDAAFVLCVHALHVFAPPRQEEILQQMARGLRPGGVLVLVAFCRQEWLPWTLWRVARDHGLRAALDLAPWRVGDAALTLRYGRGHRRPAADLVKAVREAGLEASEPEETFRGCSTLIVARRP